MTAGAHFQMVDPRASWTMVEALLDGEPPPPSAFDALAGSGRVWSDACERVRDPDPRAAALAAFTMLIRWNAASFPSVNIGDFGLAVPPRTMDPALLPLPQLALPPTSVFTALLHRRPDIDAGVFRELFEHGVGGYILGHHRDGRLWRRYVVTRPAPLRDKLLPLLALVRAAQRRDLYVVESIGLLDAGSADRDALWTPGLDRFAAAGGPLSPGEWEALAAAPLPDYGDLEDVVDRLAGADPRDDAFRGPILRWIGRVRWSSYLGITDDLLPDVLTWLERAFAAGIHERTWALHQELAACFVNRSAPREIETAWALAALRERPDDAELAAAVIQLYAPFQRRPPTPELATALLEANERYPSKIFVEYVPGYFRDWLIDHGAVVPRPDLTAATEQTLVAVLAAYRDARDDAITLLDLIRRAVTEQPPSPALGELAGQLLFRLNDDSAHPMEEELVDAFARTWLAFHRAMPEAAVARLARGACSLWPIPVARRTLTLVAEQGSVVTPEMAATVRALYGMIEEWPYLWETHEPLLEAVLGPLDDMLDDM